MYINHDKGLLKTIIVGQIHRPVLISTIVKPACALC